MSVPSRPWSRPGANVALLVGALGLLALPACREPRPSLGACHQAVRRRPVVSARGEGRPGSEVGVQFYGTWSSYTEHERAVVLDKLAAANVGWVRIDLGWASFEEHGRGKISRWYQMLADCVVDGARARGLRVLATLWSTPKWANGGKPASVPPSNPEEYGRIAAWAAAHFRGRVQAWEIWNEPNLEEFFAGRDAARYAGLLTRAYPAIKGADPVATVVLGGPSHNDTAWLRRVYDAGARGSFDVMAVHPYQGVADAAPETPDDGTQYTLAHVAAVRELMVSRGDGDKEIWFTEFGWSSHDNPPGVRSWKRGVTPEQQGDYLLRTLNLVRTSYPYVTAAFWYNERNLRRGDPHLDNFGLLDATLEEKPAYHALRGALGPHR